MKKHKIKPTFAFAFAFPSFQHPLSSTKIRSNVELLRFCHKHWLCIDPAIVNCNRVTPSEAESHFRTSTVQKMISELGPLYCPVPNFYLCEYSFVPTHLWPSANANETMRRYFLCIHYTSTQQMINW